MPEIDLRAAYESFECQPHAFIVAMPQIDPERGPINLTKKRARIKRNTWLSAGTVIAAGCFTGLIPGDWVLCSPKWAKRLTGIQSGVFVYDGPVWIFGITSPHVRTSQVVNSCETAIGVLGGQEDRFTAAAAHKCGRIKFDGACGCGIKQSVRVVDNIRKDKGRVVISPRVLLELPEKDSMRGELHIPETARETTRDVAQVVAKSPSASFVSVGDYVIYQRRGIDGLYPEGDTKHAYVPERAIFARCREPKE